MQSPFARGNFLQSSNFTENFCRRTALTESFKSGTVTHPKRFGVIPGGEKLSANMRNLGGTS
jgi:hypothetical protein